MKFTAKHERIRKGLLAYKHSFYNLKYKRRTSIRYLTVNGLNLTNENLKLFFKKVNYNQNCSRHTNLA